MLHDRESGVVPPTLLPYSRPYWDESEVQAIADVVRSGWWTAGSQVASFEQELADALEARHVVAVGSGTAAIQGLLKVIGAGPGSLVVTSALNFVAGPAVARLAGCDVAFTDVDAANLNMCPASLDEILQRTSGRYRRIVLMPVHFAGLPVDMAALSEVAESHAAYVLEDACHAIGGRHHDGRPVGGLAGSTGAVFSFHPTKPVAAGEGGAVATQDDAVADQIRLLRNHNMQRPPAPAAAEEPWRYVVDEPGLNLRMSEFHAAVARVQLGRLEQSLTRRRALADRYRTELASHEVFRYLPPNDGRRSAHHLFPVSFDLPRLGLTRQAVFTHYKQCGIALQVHYVPVTEQRAFAAPAISDYPRPALARLAPGLVSLPLFFGMTDADQDRVLEATDELASGRVRA